MGIQDTFAANIRTFRKRAGLTQEELAEKSGLHRTYIGGAEQRRINVSLKNVSKIADALEVDPALLLLRGTEEASSSTQEEYEHALLTWTDKGIDVQALAVEDPDLSVQILNALIAEGYEGDELIKRYHQSQRELLKMFKSQLASQD